MFRGAFRDELMCMMHFQILVLLSAEARLQREVRLLLRDRGMFAQTPTEHEREMWIRTAAD